jgi:hypothetical protein
MVKITQPDWYSGEREALLAVLAGGSTASGGTVDMNGPVQKLVDAVNATQALITGGDRPRALTRTRELTDEVSKLTGGPPILWIWLAQLQTQLGGLTDAERALARVEKPEALAADERRHHDETRATVERLRRSWGLPAGDSARLPADAEPGYSQTFTGVHRLLADRKLPAARAAVDAGLREYPGVPGLALLACEVGLRQNRLREAARKCDAALAAMEPLPRAHYLKAHLRLAFGDHAGAVTAFRRAVTLDPAESSYREDLIRLLRDLGRTKEASVLVAEREVAPTATRAAAATDSSTATAQSATPPAVTSPPAEPPRAKPTRPFNAWSPTPTSAP